MCLCCLSLLQTSSNDHDSFSPCSLLIGLTSLFWTAGWSQPIWTRAVKIRLFSIQANICDDSYTFQEREREPIFNVKQHWSYSLKAVCSGSAFSIPICSFSSVKDKSLTKLHEKHSIKEMSWVFRTWQQMHPRLLFSVMHWILAQCLCCCCFFHITILRSSFLGSS